MSFFGKRVVAIIRRTGAGMLWGSCLLSVSGCLTPLPHAADRRGGLHEREDYLLLQEELQRLSGRIEALEAEQQYVDRQVTRSGQEAARTVNEATRALDSRLSALEQRIEAVDAARQKDRAEIVDSLARRMEEVWRQTASATPASRAGMRGYEHEIKPGETLSEIARAYGVTMRAIIEANNLSDPDRLRAGRILFIPE